MQPTVAPAVAIHVQLLGRFVVELPDGRRAGPWGRPTARRLMQLIALHPDRRIGRGEIAEALFPNLAPERAANGVAKALSMARTAIGQASPGGAPTLVGDRASIWVDEAVELRTDLDEHRSALTDALGLPPGDARDAALVRALDDDRDLLPDEPYAPWALEPRSSLDELRGRARLTLARDRSSGAGRADADSVVAAWTDVTASDAPSEESAIALMRAHVAAGQRERAIRAYVRCAAALREELDAAPSPRLEAAYAELIARPETAAAAPPHGAWLQGGRRLFGRDRVLTVLRRRLGTTPDGRGPALLVVGPAGIGKSHLLATVAAELERAGWRPLLGRSVQEDRRAPFAALRQALAPIGGEAVGLGSPALLRLLGLGDDAAGTEDGVEPGEAAQASLAAEVGRLLDAAAKRNPLVVVLDDLQWADRSLQAILSRLVARPDARRWAILAAARSDEPDAPVPALGTSVASIELPPLSERATGAAVRAALDEEGLRPSRSTVAAAVGRGRGNPFFAIELARAGGGSGVVAEGAVPDAIVRLLRRRLGAVSAAARSMLSIVALAGGDATYDVVLGALARIGGAQDREGPAPHIGLDELIGGWLVVETGDRLVLAHPLLRDAAVSTVNAIRRGAIHEAIAETLEDAEGASATVRGEAAARHRLAAFEAARLRSAARAAAEAGFTAGRRAREAHAADAALRLLRGALGAHAALSASEREALSPRACAAWLTIGNIHLDREEDADAEAAYREARRTALDDGDVARASSALAGIPYRHGDMAGALAAYRAGIASLRGDDPRARARLESDAAWVLARRGQDTEALEILERVAPVLLAAPEPHLRCRTADRLGLVLDWLDRTEEGLAWLDRGVEDALEHEDDRDLMVLSLHRGEVLGRVGRHDEAEADLARAARIADAAGDRYVRAVTHGRAAHLHERRGDLGAALAERDAELEILGTVRNDRHIAMAHAHRAKLLKWSRRTALAWRAAAAARQAANLSGDAEFASELVAELAALGLGGKDSGTTAS